MDPVLFTALISGQHYLPTLNFGPNTKEINFEVTGSDKNWVYFDGNMERFITDRMFEWSSRINELSIDVHKDNLMNESEDMFGVRSLEPPQIHLEQFRYPQIAKIAYK